MGPGMKENWATLAVSVGHHWKEGEERKLGDFHDEYGVGCEFEMMIGSEVTSSEGHYVGSRVDWFERDTFIHCLFSFRRGAQNFRLCRRDRQHW